MTIISLICRLHAEHAVHPPDFCDCHADGLKKGGVTLDSHRDMKTLLADRDLWQRIRTQIDFRVMPPPDEERGHHSSQSEEWPEALNGRPLGSPRKWRLPIDDC